MKNTKKPTLIITAIVIGLGLTLQGCAEGKLHNDDMLPPGAQTGQIGMSEQNNSVPGHETLPEEQINDTKSDIAKNQTGGVGDQPGASPESGAGRSAAQAVDLNVVKPNESGKIMVVMFHNFIEKYEKGDKTYTTTFGEFRGLLDTLYASGYRLVGLNDYLNGNIDTPAGCIPVAFTFDDGTAGQFSLIEENGVLKANPKSAVGILEEFAKIHPDFGVKGTFFVNLGNKTFGSAGTLSQRLEYLIGKGFEIGNHTYSHINLKIDAKTAAIVQKEIGANQKKMYELVPGYTFAAFSLPFGAPSKDLTDYVIKGEYDGTQYENKAIMEVGWDPAPSPFSVGFDPLSTHRVRSSGIDPVLQDLAWWLANMKRESQYISDGNADTVTVPEACVKNINMDSLNGRTLVTY